MQSDTALVTANGMPAMEVADAVQRYKMLNSFVGQILREGTDYGKIPGGATRRRCSSPARRN